MAQLVDSVFDGYRKGDKVRVTIEGIIYDTSDGLNRGAYIHDDNGKMSWIASDTAIVVELIEPNYERGAVYKDALGVAYRFLEGTTPEDSKWQRFGRAGEVDFDRPKRPLEKISGFVSAEVC
jgi:hypothetical protein